MFEDWREGSMKEDEACSGELWRQLSKSEDIEVHYRVREERIEIKVAMWLWSSVSDIVTAITDVSRRTQWDERVERACVMSSSGGDQYVHYDMCLGGDSFPLDLRCNTTICRDFARVDFKQVDSARLHEISSYELKSVLRSRSPSCDSAPSKRELQHFLYTTVFTSTSTRLLLADMLGKQTYFFRTWTHLKEYLELGFSYHSRVLPPLTQPHRSIAVACDIIRYLTV